MDPSNPSIPSPDSDTQTFPRTEYANPQFWNDRFQEHAQQFDWYCSYSDIKHILDSHITKSSHILLIGSGTSPLPLQMVDDGYLHLTNIDISSIAIDAMVAKTPEDKQNACQWLVMDACNMSFPSNSFDAIIDKGTLDAIATHTEKKNAITLLAECGRVLKQDTGHLFLISHTDWKGRKALLFPSQHCSLGIFSEEKAFSWCVEECIKVFLNDMSNFINYVRAALPGSALRSVFLSENSEVLAGALKDLKSFRGKKAMGLFLDMMSRKARRRRMAEEESVCAFNVLGQRLEAEGIGTEVNEESLEGKDEKERGLRQNHCFLTVLRKE